MQQSPFIYTSPSTSLRRTHTSKLSRKDLSNEFKINNEDSLKNEDFLKNKDSLQDEDNFKNEYDLKMKTS